MSTWHYIGILAAFVVGAAGLAYAESDVRTVYVTGKYVEDVSGRRGRTSKRYILRTDEGDLPILKFPVLGYASGADAVYAGISTGSSIEVRISHWPPRFLGQHGRNHILAIY